MSLENQLSQGICVVTDGRELLDDVFSRGRNRSRYAIFTRVIDRCTPLFSTALPHWMRTPSKQGF